MYENADFSQHEPLQKYVLNKIDCGTLFPEVKNYGAITAMGDKNNEANNFLRYLEQGITNIKGTFSTHLLVVSSSLNFP